MKYMIFYKYLFINIVKKIYVTHQLFNSFENIAKVLIVDFKGGSYKLSVRTTSYE